MAEFDSEGFAKPWLAFEKQIGQRPALRGPISKYGSFDDQFNALGSVLIQHLTFAAPDASVKSEDNEITPGLKTRIYTPPNYEGDKPVCVFYHGGGWAMGDLEGEDAQLRTISKDAGVVILSIDYRLAPKHPYPAGLDDCVAAYHWAIDNSELLKTKKNEAIVFGTSAGGNLALGVALRLIDGGKADTLKGLVAVVPVTIAPEAVPEELKSNYTSYEEHADHTINTKSGMEAFYAAYQADPKDPFVSPLLHKKLKDLPKVYLAVAGQDTLRDDGRLLRSALDEAGVPNLYDEYAGYPHWFWAFPSEHLAEPIELYNRNLKKGFEFVLS